MTNSRDNKSSDSSAVLHNCQLQLCGLDALELPFLFLDQNYQPQFLSSRGARILGIRNRSELSSFSDILEPLQSLSQSTAQRRNKQISPSALNDVHTRDVKEIELKAVEGREFPALAFSRPLGFSCENTSDSTSGFITVFHDLSFLEPFITTMTQSRRNRSILVLVSCFLGRSLALDPNQKDLLAGYQTAESEFFKQHPSQIEMPLTSDLLGALTSAVEIVDPFIVSSSKILLDVGTPLILAISRANFLRIVCHLLLESTDFAGPFGTSRVKTTLESPSTEELWRMGKDKVAELTFRAERHAQIPLEATPLELYMHRHYMPVQYRVSVKEAEVPENLSANHHATPLVSEHALSDNLTIASHLAKACGGELHIQRPSEEKLTLSARFKLHTGGNI